MGWVESKYIRSMELSSPRYSFINGQQVRARNKHSEGQTSESNALHSYNIPTI